MIFQAAVEGDLDEAILRRVALHVDIDLGTVYGRQGKQHLKASINGYNAAAKHHPWAVLVDLDQDQCPAELRRVWLPNEAPFLCFRVAVRQIEAWLLADRANTAALLGVSRALLPDDPDSEPDAKLTLVQLAKRSRWRKTREALAPPAGAKRKVGPLYTGILRAFAASGWNPEEAANRSESLRRCLVALETVRSRASQA